MKLQEFLKQDIKIAVRDRIIEREGTHRVSTEDAAFVGKLLTNLFIEAINDEIKKGVRNPIKVAQAAINAVRTIVSVWDNAEGTLHFSYVQYPQATGSYMSYSRPTLVVATEFSNKKSKQGKVAPIRKVSSRKK